jgi:hypothetical protein
MGHAIFAIFLLAGAAAMTNAADSLPYEPAIVELTGRVTRHVFPGPPNYESLETDNREVCWILQLERPINVIATDDSLINYTENKVRRVQLVWDSQQYQKYRGLLHYPVIITGTLFHAISGHHHTPVLLMVLRLRAKPPHRHEPSPEARSQPRGG